MAIQRLRGSQRRNSRLEILIVLLACWLPSAPTRADTSQIAARYAQSLAVVIGIDRYPDPTWKDLQYARKGAVAVADLLRRKGFEVRELLDEAATKHRILSALTDTARRLESDGRDRVLIYFAGHGYTESIGGSDRGYIVPYDGRDVAGYLSIRELQSISELMDHARHQLFLMDACYGGLLAITHRGSYAQRPGLIREFLRRKARQYLTAGGKNQRVMDKGRSEHSVFTGQLLAAIGEGKADRDFDGVVTFAELASYMEKAASNQYQTPLHGTLPGDEGGSFLFGVASSAKTTNRSPEPGAEEHSLRLSGRLRSVDDPREPTGSSLKPPRTYRIRAGSPQTLETLGVTAAASFSTVESVPVATLTVGFPGGTGDRKPAFGPGTRLTFEAGDQALRGTVLDIDWNRQEITFTLGPQE